MKTDLNRLHDVVLGNLTYPGCGKTYAKCHELANTIILFDEEYDNIDNKHLKTEDGFKRSIICLLSHYDDVEYLHPMIIEVLHQYGMSIDLVQRNRMRVSRRCKMFLAGTELLFFQYDEFMYGTSFAFNCGNYVVDFRWTEECGEQI